MITEGMLALIWAAAAMTFFGNVKELNLAMLANNNNAAWAANEIALNMLGKVGRYISIIGYCSSTDYLWRYCF